MAKSWGMNLWAEQFHPLGLAARVLAQRPDVVSRFSCRISTNCSSAGDNSSLSVHLVKPNLKDC